MPPAPSNPRAARRPALAVAALFVAALGCQSTSVDVDPLVAPFVGDWTASSVVLTNQADTAQHPDIIALGATFSLNVQPSGAYSALLTYLGQPVFEQGQASVTGNVITLDPQIPADRAKTSGTFDFLTDSTFVIDGDTEFDFNLDGTDEAATVHMEFGKKSG